jgi:cell wall-associated NlpC family hydrolase
MFAASYGNKSGLSAGAVLVVAALAAAGCASTGAVPRPFPAPAGTSSPAPAPEPPAAPYPESPSPADVSSPAGSGIVATAMSLRGVPYRNGGSDPAGFDCSGFVTYVFGQHGLAVPRTVAGQYHAGTDVGSDLQAGDLVFFDTGGGGVSHVGIAIGGDEFVHAPSSTGEVRVEHLNANYWSRRYRGARRLI